MPRGDFEGPVDVLTENGTQCIPISLGRVGFVSMAAGWMYSKSRKSGSRQFGHPTPPREGVLGVTYSHPGLAPIAERQLVTIRRRNAPVPQDRAISAKGSASEHVDHGLRVLAAGSQ